MRTFMVDRAIIEQILSIAVNAPSGDNSQPWEFALDGNMLSIFNLGERDATIYNHRQRGSYLSHGALVENIAIAASAHQIKTEVRAFPGDGRTAEIRFAPSENSADPLSDAILRRTTNRKPYQARRLAEADRSALLSAGTAFGTEIKIVEDPQEMRQVASAVGANEKLLFEYQELHDFLFSMIRWTEAEEHATPGLYVLTMEFPAPLRFLLKNVFQRWSVVSLLNRVGLSQMISKQSTENHAACSAFGAVVLTAKTDVDYFNAGRTLERFWLTATARGISMQPVTAMPYLLERVREGDADMFTAEQRASIVSSGEQIERAFRIEQGSRIAMLFRFGYSDPPTAHSAKLPPRFRSI